MNILLIAPHPFFQERGTPIAVKLLIETLSEFGHKIDLLTFNEGKDIVVEGLRIFRIPDLPFLQHVKIGFSLKKILADIILTFLLIKLLLKNKYQVIHAVEESIFPAALLNRFFKKKLVYDMDSSLSDQLIEKWAALNKVNKFLDSFEKWASKHSTAVIPVCKYLGDKIIEYHPGKKIQVLEDISFEPDHSKDNKENIRSYFNSNELIGLYIGNLVDYQGIDLLLEGLTKVKTNIPFAIGLIGGDEDSIESYKTLVNQLDLNNTVKFLGKRPLDQLPFLLEQGDILLSPRIKGGNTPMKIYSYLASGKPVLATRIDSHTQAMSEKEVKFFDPDSESFAVAFKELLENEEERKVLGFAGKKLAKKNYSLRSYKQKLKEIYNWLETE